MGAINPAHMHKEPIERMMAPKNGQFIVFVDHWWPVTWNNEILFYTRGRGSKYLSPQCNQSREVALAVAKGYSELVARIEQLAVVFVPLNINDYI